MEIPRVAGRFDEKKDIVAAVGRRSAREVAQINVEGLERLQRGNQRLKLGSIARSDS